MNERGVVSVQVIDTDHIIRQTEQELILGNHIDLPDRFIAEGLVELEERKSRLALLGIGIESVP